MLSDPPLKDDRRREKKGVDATFSGATFARMMSRAGGKRSGVSDRGSRDDDSILGRGSRKPPEPPPKPSVDPFLFEYSTVLEPVACTFLSQLHLQQTFVN